MIIFCQDIAAECESCVPLPPTPPAPTHASDLAVTAWVPDDHTASVKLKTRSWKDVLHPRLCFWRTDLVNANAYRLEVPWRTSDYICDSVSFFCRYGLASQIFTVTECWSGNNCMVSILTNLLIQLFREHFLEIYNRFTESYVRKITI